MKVFGRKKKEEEEDETQKKSDFDVAISNIEKFKKVKDFETAFSILNELISKLNISKKYYQDNLKKYYSLEKSADKEISMDATENISKTKETLELIEERLTILDKNLKETERICPKDLLPGASKKKKGFIGFIRSLFFHEVKTTQISDFDKALLIVEKNKKTKDFKTALTAINELIIKHRFSKEHYEDTLNKLYPLEKSPTENISKNATANIKKAKIILNTIYKRLAILEEKLHEIEQLHSEYILSKERKEAGIFF